MNRAMYSGVAGLRTHQTRMDVIGNNIANVNTVGYKAQAALFSDLLYQNSSNASGPNGTTGIGGINAKQVGLGAKMASISTNITLAGSAETTNNPFDLRITGDSFFIVNNGSVNMFTRDGSFKVDAAGNLVMSSNGYMVMGWQVEPNSDPPTIKPDTVSALQIMNAANMTYPPEATTKAYVSGIVDAESPEVNSDDGKMMNLNFYDSRGYSYTAKLAIKRVAGKNDNVNSYSCELVKLLNASGTDVTATAGATMDTTAVKLAAEEKLSLTDSYELVKNGANSYIIRSKTEDSKGNHYEYVINGGTVTGLYCSAPNTEVVGDDAKVVTTEEAWEGVALAFGYTDPNEFQKMTADVTTGTGTTTYKIKSQLGELMDVSGMDTNADGSKAGSITLTGKEVTGVTVDFSKQDGSFVGLSGGTGATAFLRFGDTPDASNFEDIEIDFSTLRNVGNEKVSTASATRGSLKNEGAGRMIGNMSGLSIEKDGKIYAAYDNGQTKLLGQIAVASFANPSGLQKEGDNLYQTTQNSGEFDGIGHDITSDEGYMTTGELEMSNVDLSGELTSMIVTQRGFQANSRIITVSDTMLEELINLKR